MIATFHEHDESLERTLFARRAALPGARVGVPSLEAVLRAARADARESSSGRRRTWGGVALAAACLLSVWKTRVGDGAPTLVANVRSDAALSSPPPGGMCEVQGAWAVCADPASVEGSPRESVVRTAPPPRPPWSSADALCCRVDDPGRSEAR